MLFCSCMHIVRLMCLKLEKKKGGLQMQGIGKRKHNGVSKDANAQKKKATSRQKKIPPSDHKNDLSSVRTLRATLVLKKSQTAYNARA